jgi:hypothetical protein
MNDCEVLERAAKLLRECSFAAAATCCEKVSTFCPQPPPDTIPVRVAVVAAGSVQYGIIAGAYGIDRNEYEPAMRSAVRQVSGYKIVGHCIATIHVPRLQIPEVTASVEESING